MSHAPDLHLVPAAPDAEPGRRPFSNVSICLTPHAFPPGACPPYADEARWVRAWALNPAKPMALLAQRLARPPAALSAHAVEGDDIEIRATVPHEPDPVVVALVAFGLTAEQCDAGLAELGRGRDGRANARDSVS